MTVTHEHVARMRALTDAQRQQLDNLTSGSHVADLMRTSPGSVEESAAIQDLNDHRGCVVPFVEELDRLSPPFVTPTTVEELQPGDIVRRTDGGLWSGSHDTDPHEVREIRNGRAYVDAATYSYVGTRDNDGEIQYPWEFVSRPGVTPEPEVPAIDADTTFDAYHPSMFPMIEKLSATADAAGFCAEYDRMARSIGAPTRAEVRRIVRERDGQRRRIAFPVTINVVYDTEDVTADDADAIRELRDKLSSWEGLADLIASNVRDRTWSALPTGGTIPEGREITTF